MRAATVGFPEGPLKRLEHSVEVLESNFFSPVLGSYPTSIDWTAAFISTVLSATFNVLHSHRYFSHLVSFYHRQHTAALRLQAFDDQLWVVLSWLQAAEYATTTEPEWATPFRQRAEEFYDLAARGWDETCGGGMLWRKDGPPYKNAITNELFITSSVEMYRHFPHRREYLHNAMRAWIWLDSSGLRNSHGLYADGLHNCTTIEATTWTYNQGVILTGLAGLSEFTGSPIPHIRLNVVVHALALATGR